jgi:hypothetical protein
MMVGIGRFRAETDEDASGFGESAEDCVVDEAGVFGDAMDRAAVLGGILGWGIAIGGLGWAKLVGPMMKGGGGFFGAGAGM